MADEKGNLKTFSFSKIQQFQWKDDTKLFTPKKEFLNQLSQNKLNWFTTDKLIEVTLQIDNSVKEYFTRRDILANQKIIEENNFYFIISTKVSYDDEILSVVKYWLPYIIIVKPLYLKEKLERVLLLYMNTNK